MILGVAFGGLARMIGIVAIFSMLGPFAFAALVLLLVAVFGAPLLELMQAFVSPGTLRSLVSVAAWVLGFAAILASVIPSAITGLIFAVAAIGAGINAMWMAWLAAAAAIAAVMALGAAILVPESSAVILPKAQTAGQGIALFTMLAILAIPPATLCWWLAKPLHHANLVT